MRKEFLLTFLFCAVTVSPGQVSVRTPSFSFGSPQLSIRGDFLGEEGTTWLNAGSGGTLVLSISNSGKATARSAVVAITPVAPLNGIRITGADSLGDLKPGEVRTEKIPVSASEDAVSGKGALLITVSAGPGVAPAETKVEIVVREIPSPRLDIRLAAAGESIAPGEISTIKAKVRNTGSGEARGVSATFLAAAGGTDPGLAEMGKTMALGTIAQGSTKEIALTLAPAAGAGGQAAFIVRLDEERAKSSVFVTLSVLLKGGTLAAQETGMAAFRKGDYNQAIASLETVAGAGKASKEVYFSLGVSYFKNRNRGRCLSSMQKSAAMGSREAKAWMAENTSPVLVTTVTYKVTENDPFQGYAPPVGLGVLPFADSLAHDTQVTARMYDALRAKNETFRIFPFSTVWSAHAARGLTAGSPPDKHILGGLEKELSMNFALIGLVRDTAGSAFRMQIIRCSDGATVFAQEFRTSTTSTALDDAVAMLLKGRVPVYKSSRIAEVKLP